MEGKVICVELLRVSLTEGFFFLFPLLLARIWMQWLELKQSSWTVEEFGKEAMHGGTKRYKTEATRKEPYHTALHAHLNIYSSLLPLAAKPNSSFIQSPGAVLAQTCGY